MADNRNEFQQHIGVGERQPTVGPDSRDVPIISEIDGTRTGTYHQKKDGSQGATMTPAVGHINVTGGTD